ncbi:hypothetical protein IQ265_13160 [Nodosilinea sp. LEGE 06152]|uniref:hypothetical protein n=1 Tax=Nodosilinea sp. LEGE 06152 TaxID=2777966 RepID=UPI001880D87A|nr:hypothetical protein [Nodosilinea sp. LEGE 06152]MBE9157765.1 hypothetical protein [Nodosilinea sp. LEGE 06152]
MEAVEFEANIKNGSIEVPAAYRSGLIEGDKVKVILLKTHKAEQIQAVKALFKETQALPQAQTITEDEIAAEIAAYRARQ